ncbi:MAG: PQQ-binding-like beta-propeller repeat protein [Bacteroidota bacterium]
MIKIFKDGKLVSNANQIIFDWNNNSNLPLNTNVSASFPLIIGKSEASISSSGSQLDAGPTEFLDDICMYNRALNFAEIDSLYHEGGWNQNPFAPTLALPLNNATEQPTTVTLSWMDSTINANSIAKGNYLTDAKALKNKKLSAVSLSYKVQIGTDSSFASGIFKDTALTQTSTTISGLKTGTMYYWRVDASDSAWTSTWSSVWHFTTLYFPQSGLVAYYPFNGNANDESGNGNNGKVTGAILSTDRYGQSNSAYSFGGNGEYIDCGNSSAFNITGSISIAAFIYSNNFDTDHGILSKMAGGSSTITYDLVTNAPNSTPPLNRIRWLGLFSKPINTGQWYFIVTVFDAQARKAYIYVDGALSDSFSNTPSTIASNSDHVYIGAHQPLSIPQWSWNGKLDDIRIYNRVLNIAEIDSLYHEGGWNPISAPTELGGSASDGKVILSWKKGAQGTPVRFRIYRANSSPASVLIDSVSSDTTQYTDSGVTNGSVYYYRLTEVNSSLVESNFSNEISVTPFNHRPIAVPLRDTSIFNAGRIQTTQITLSALGSYDPDGTIDSIFWYVNNNLVAYASQLTNDLVYNFGPGTSKVMLVVQDNKGGRDTSAAKVTRVASKIALNGPIDAGMSLLGDSVLYAIATGDAIYRIDYDGNIVLSLSVNGNVLSASSIGFDTTVYIGSTDRNLYAFSKNGVPLWPPIPLGGVLSATPTIDSANNRLYVGVQNRNFFAINRTTGLVAWNFFSNAPITNSAVITTDGILVFSTAKGTIYGFDLKNLPSPVTPAWVLSLQDTITTSPAIDAQGYFYFGTRSGRVDKISLSRGESASIVWDFQSRSSILASPVIDAKGTIYVGSLDSSFYAIDGSTGVVKWSRYTAGSIYSTATISNSGIIYFANDAGELFAVDSSANVQWFYQHRAAIRAPLLCRTGTLYVGTDDSTVLAFYDGSGNVSGLASESRSAMDSTVPQWPTFQGNNQRTGVQFGVASSKGNSVNTSLSAGWQIVSVPVTVLYPLKTTLFPTSSSQAYTYADGYITKDTLSVGSAYWLKFPSGGPFHFNGFQVKEDTIAIRKGWNMVGSISVPIPIANVVSIPGGIITSKFFGYNKGYFMNDSILPGRGYWIKTNQEGQLILSSSSSISSVAHIRIVPSDEMPPSPPGEVETKEAGLPNEYVLAQNYPNPFNPTTMFMYALPYQSRIRFIIYNVLGQVVGTLNDGIQPAGYREAMWNASNVASGIYFYRLDATSVNDPSKHFSQTRKMVLIK